MDERNFFSRLSELQKELIAPKNNYNSFGKYKYRSAEDILEAVKPLNKKYDLALFISDEPVLVGDRYYIKAIATLVDAKDPKNQIVSTAYARESENKKGQDDSQITGTASSYARKYALNGMYLIDDTKDADTDEHRKQGEKGNQGSQQQSGTNLISPAQVKMLGAKVGNIAKANGQDQAAVYESACKHFNISKSTKELTKAEASKIIDYLAKLEG